MIEGPKKLKKWMRSVGSSQTGLAVALDISRGSLVNYLRGAATPGLGPAVRLERLSNGAVPVEAWVEKERETKEEAR
mgnify:CR=1 FL=1